MIVARIWDKPDNLCGPEVNTRTNVNQIRAHTFFLRSLVGRPDNRPAAMRHDDCMKPTSLIICSVLVAASGAIVLGAWGQDQPGDWTEQAISPDRATAQ